jgi:flagellar hook assembly protein FlgD
MIEDNPANGWINGAVADTYTIGGTSGVIQNDNALVPQPFAFSAIPQKGSARGVAVSFRIAQAGNVTIDLYDIKGKNLRSLISGFFTPGSYTVVWNGMNRNGCPHTSGIYICRMRAGSIERNILLTYKKWQP